MKMSDFGFAEDEAEALAQNARDTMGGLFLADPFEMSHADCVSIYKKSYR